MEQCGEASVFYYPVVCNDAGAETLGRHTPLLLVSVIRLQQPVSPGHVTVGHHHVSSQMLARGEADPCDL